MPQVYLHFDSPETLPLKAVLQRQEGFEAVFGRSDVLACDEKFLIACRERDPDLFGRIRIAGLSAGIEAGISETRREIAADEAFFRVKPRSGDARSLLAALPVFSFEKKRGLFTCQREALANPQVRSALRRALPKRQIGLDEFSEVFDKTSPAQAAEIFQSAAALACSCDGTERLEAQEALALKLCALPDGAEIWGRLLRHPALAGIDLPPEDLRLQIKGSSDPEKTIREQICSRQTALSVQQANRATGEKESQSALRMLGKALRTAMAAKIRGKALSLDPCTPDLGDLASRMHKGICSQDQTALRAADNLITAAQISFELLDKAAIEDCQKICEGFERTLAKHGAGTVPSLVLLPQPAPEIKPEFPLYLKDVTPELRHSRPGVFHWDQSNMAWHCALNEQNLKDFAANIPEPRTADQQLALVSDQIVDERIRKELSKAGFSQRCIEHLSVFAAANSHDGWIRDPAPHQGYLQYKIIRSDSPLLVIRNWHGGECKSIPLAKRSKEEWQKMWLSSRSAEEENRLCDLNAKIALAKKNLEQGKTLIPGDGSDPYSQKKHVNLGKCGALADPDGSFTRFFSPEAARSDQELHRRCVYLPLCNASGQTVGWQQLCADSKRFEAGIPTKGIFAAIGGFDRVRRAQALLICEGSATAASVNALLSDAQRQNTAVIAGLNCGNLEAVALALARNFPAAQIGICADNDALTASHPLVKNTENSGEMQANPGISGALAARAALQALGRSCDLIMPPLRRSALQAHLSDFNDSAQLEPELTKQRVREAAETLLKKAALNQASQRVYSALAEHTKNKRRELQKLCGSSPLLTGGIKR